jgi:hypothetical protein
MSEAFVVIEPSAVVTRVVRFPKAVDVAETPVVGSLTVVSNAVTSAAIDVMELPCAIVVVSRTDIAFALVVTFEFVVLKDVCRFVIAAVFCVSNKVDYC